jgi:hypothetical protein
MEDKQANNCRMYAGLYILLISYASGPLTSRNYRHKLDADQEQEGGGVKGVGGVLNTTILDRGLHNVQ